MKGFSFWLCMFVLGFTCEHILTKYLLVEVGEREETRASEVPCRGPAWTGVCEMLIRGFTFNQVSKTCEKFKGVCSYTKNGFETKEECEAKCANGILDTRQIPYPYPPYPCGDSTNLCANKKCGEMCAPQCGVLTVVRHCQPNGLCNMNSRPKCGKVSYIDNLTARQCVQPGNTCTDNSQCCSQNCDEGTCSGSW